MRQVKTNYNKNIIAPMCQVLLGCAIPPFLSQNDSASSLSGNAFPQDNKTIKIICVASVLGVPQDTTFL